MKRINDPNHARYLTFSTYQRVHLFTSPELRDAFADQLRTTRERHEFRLYAWVLMPNHAHLLIREPKCGDLTNILRTLKLGFSKRLLNRWDELGVSISDQLIDEHGTRRIWQRGGGYDRNIHSVEEFDEKVHYIHMNPVRAGLVNHSTDWAWSSARWWDGDRDDQIQCDQRTK